MGAQELLNVWLLPLVQEVGGILEEAYCTSHQLLGARRLYLRGERCSKDS